MERSMGVGTYRVVVAAAAVVAAAVFAAALAGPPQYAFADGSPALPNLTEIVRITDDYSLFRHSGEVKDIATFESAGRAYAAVTSRDDVQVLNLTDPDNIVLAGRIGNLGSGHMDSGLKIATFESAGRAYAAVVSGAGVRVLNLTDPDNIVLADNIAHDFGPGITYKPGIATFESAGRAYAIVSVFLGDMICLPEQFGTYDCPDYDDKTILQVLDLTDPDNIFPTIRIVHDGLHPYHSDHIATFESDGRAYAVTVARAVQVLNRTEAVQVLNLTGPGTLPAGHIVPAGHIADDDRLRLRHANSVATFESDGRAYAVVTSTEGVQALNLTDPNNIVPAGRIAYNLWLTGAKNIATFESDGRAYAAVSMSEGIEMLDLTDPNSIVPAGRIAYGNGLLADAKNIATFESDGRAYAVAWLADDVWVIQLTVNADRAAYGVAQADDATVTYEVVTSEPVCDAEYLDRLEAVTRLTFLNSGLLFNTASGIPVRIQVSEGQAQDVVQSLLGRPSVISVQREGPPTNGSGAEWPVEINPNAATREVAGGGCYDNVGTTLEFKIREAIIHRDWGSYAPTVNDSGSGFGDRVARGELPVSMYVNNITSIVEWLEDNGALVTSRTTGEYKGQTVRVVSAVIPPLLAIPLSERDDFRSMNYVAPTDYG